MIISTIDFNSSVDDTVFLDHIGFEAKVNSIKVVKYYTIVSYIYVKDGLDVEHTLHHINYNPKD